MLPYTTSLNLSQPLKNNFSCQPAITVESGQRFQVPSCKNDMSISVDSNISTSQSFYATCRDKIFRTDFNRCLTWEPYTWQLQTKCQWLLNILCFLTGAADRIVMLSLYCCPFHLQLDCGSFICSFASKIVLYTVDPVHISVICLSTEIFRVRRVRGTCTCLSFIDLPISYAANLNALKKHS
jgi:hypothetical protein